MVYALPLYDQSKDETTHALTNKILSSGYFTLEVTLFSINDIECIFRRGKIREVIVFESGFEEKLQREGRAAMQIITDASDPVTARLATSYTKGIVEDFIRKDFQASNHPASISTEIRMFFNEDMKSAWLFVPGVMALILMLVSALMTSVSITREKETGTMEVLLVSPLRPIQIITGKVFPYLILSVANALIILLTGHFVFAVPVKGSFILLLFESVLYTLMALCMGIFISTISKNQIMAMFISLVGLMLPTVLLSGFIFPSAICLTSCNW